LERIYVFSKYEGHWACLLHQQTVVAINIECININKNFCINVDQKFCINAGHNKTHGDIFSYRRPLPTPSIDHTKSSSAAPPQQIFVFSNPNQRYKPSAATTIDSHPPAAAPAVTPPSTVPSPSATTTDQQAPVQQ